MNLKLLKMAWQNAKAVRKSCSKSALLLQRQEARKFVDSIPAETWEKVSQAVFRQPNEPKSKFLETLGRFRKFCQEQKITLSPEAEKAYQTLEYKATVMADRLNEAVSRGKTQKNYFDYGKKFKNNNKQAVEILEKQINEIESMLNAKCNNYGTPDWDKNVSLYSEISSIRSNFRCSMGFGQEFYNPKIVELSKDILHDGQVFYHGTKHQRAIAKNGFNLTPKIGQARFGARELGEGVYITPDKKVAAHYAGLRGGILPLDVKLNKVAAINQDHQAKIIMELGLNMSNGRAYTPAEMELLIKELFKRNGFNAAYTREAIGQNILMLQNAKMVDDIIGAKQAQLCVFDTKDIRILEKTFKDRCSNQALQTKSWFLKPYNVYKMIKNFIKDLKS